ncbi:unnamed protein product [Umbelopsis ramanniana]
MFPASDAFSQTVEVSPDVTDQTWPETATTNTTAPRWQIQTDQEETESRSQIEKLERKLKMAKRRQYGTVSRPVNAPIEYVDSASDSEDQPQFETDEGLSLLWNQQDEDLDNALQRRKNQDTYTQSWYHYLLCCFCCQPMTEGST